MHTIVGGQILIADGELTTIDEQRAMDEVQRRVIDLLDRIGRPVRSPWPAL